MIRTTCLMTLVALSASGCAVFTPREIAEPSAISVRQAVFEVADTLRDVQDRVPLDKRSGLLVDEVTVEFNVAAASETTNKAQLMVSNVPLAGGSLGASADTQNVSGAKRGNTITIKFKNFATADMSRSKSKAYRPCKSGERFSDGNCYPVGALTVQ